MKIQIKKLFFFSSRRRHTRSTRDWSSDVCSSDLGMQPIASWSALYLRLALRALVSPRLAVDLLRLTWSFRARDWYRRPPFLPFPPRDYMRWRMFTAYGDEAAVPPARDVVNFARWRRETMGL